MKLALIAALALASVAGGESISLCETIMPQTISVTVPGAAKHDLLHMEIEGDRHMVTAIAYATGDTCVVYLTAPSLSLLMANNYNEYEIVDPFTHETLNTGSITFGPC